MERTIKTNRGRCLSAVTPLAAAAIAASLFVLFSIDLRPVEASSETRSLKFSSAELEEFGIEIVPARPGTIATYASLPGEIRPNTDRLAHIVPRYSGIALEVRARIGDSVEKGEILAVIESDQSLAPFEVRTPISGTVLSKHITLGEAVSRDTDAYEVADLNTVWVDFAVYQRDLERIRVGQPVRISAGEDYATARGTISYITPVVDEATRTATARVVLPNLDGAWKPGMFVTGTVTLESLEAAVVVPRTAVQTLGEETVVFVADDDGLEAREITLGRTNRLHAEILDGLEPGDRFVSRGSFILRSELMKEGFEAGHGH